MRVEKGPNERLIKSSQFLLIYSHQLAIFYWASILSPLALGFFICKMKLLRSNIFMTAHVWKNLTGCPHFPLGLWKVSVRTTFPVICFTTQVVKRREKNYFLNDPCHKFLILRIYRYLVFVGFIVISQVIMCWDFSTVIFKCMRNVTIKNQRVFKLIKRRRQHNTKFLFLGLRFNCSTCEFLRLQTWLFSHPYSWCCVLSVSATH